MADDPVNPNPAPDPAPNPNPVPAGDPSAIKTPISGDPDPAANPTPNPEGDPAADPADPPKGYWPDDWRIKLAGKDEKLAKRLDRFASPEGVWKSFRAMEQRLSSGELKKALGKDASPEEVAAWRKDAGIPEKPEDYDLKFDNGLVIGKADKPLVAEFLKSMHGENATPGQVKAGIAAYYRIQEQAQATRAEQDAQARATAEDDLRAEWGVDYRRNVGMVQALLNTIPDGVRDHFANARLADGTPLFSHPDMLRYFVGIQREINPAASVVPNSNQPAQAIDAEIAGLKAMMQDQHSEYWKGPKADGHQERYRQLLTAKERMGNRAA
jgi:hypothetical protein